MAEKTRSDSNEPETYAEDTHPQGMPGKYVRVKGASPKKDRPTNAAPTENIAASISNLNNEYNVIHSPGCEIVILKDWPTPPKWKPELIDIRLEFHSNPPVVLVSDDLKSGSREPLVIKDRSLSGWKQYDVEHLYEWGMLPSTLERKLREDMKNQIR